MHKPHPFDAAIRLEPQGEGRWPLRRQGHARAHQFRNGYFDQSAELWGPGGELLAVTHQIVY